LNIHNIGRVRMKLFFENTIQRLFRNRLGNFIDNLQIRRNRIAFELFQAKTDQ